LILSRKFIAEARQGHTAKIKQTNVNRATTSVGAASKAGPKVDLRFGTAVCALVKAGLGIAVIDQFTVAHGGYPGVESLANRRADQIRYLHCGETRCAAVALHRTFDRLPALGNAGRRSCATRITETFVAGREENNTMLCWSRNRVIVLFHPWAILAASDIMFRRAPKVTIFENRHL
jgi:hypothetical protein